jgi:hypothetical protein
MLHLNMLLKNELTREKGAHWHFIDVDKESKLVSTVEPVVEMLLETLKQILDINEKHIVVLVISL